MKKKVIVLSLGGSLIIPDNVDTKFLTKFKKIIISNSKKYKFVIACGGGNLARKYIAAIKKAGGNTKLQSLGGIAATRANAKCVSYFFGIEPKDGIPEKMSQLVKQVKNKNIVICGALEYHPKQTSDSTATQIAQKVKGSFINLTNVAGLYDKNPKKFKNAKFIPKISWKYFDTMTQKLKYKPGQHFVLDQTASKFILKNKIPTYIMGENIKELDNLLKGKKYKGTIIEG